MKKEGVLVHYRWLACVWDTLEAICNIMNWKIPKWTQVTVSELVVEPGSNERGFVKRLRLEWYGDEDFNPQKFKKV